MDFFRFLDEAFLGASAHGLGFRVACRLSRVGFGSLGILHAKIRDEVQRTQESSSSRLLHHFSAVQTVGDSLLREGRRQTGKNAKLQTAE